MNGLLGSICIICASLILIWQRQCENRRRNDVLSDLIFVFRRMSEEIRMTQPPLVKLLKKLAVDCHQDTSDFLYTVSDTAGREQLISDVWKKEAKKLPISKSEQAVVIEASEVLNHDEMGICKGLLLACSGLEMSKMEWDRRRLEEERRTAAVYLSCASLLVILLI